MCRIRYLIITIISAALFSSLVLAYPLTPNDPLFDSWNENNPGGNNYGQEIVKLPSSWDFTVGSLSFPLAVVNSGFDIEHEDLKPNLNLEESDKYDVWKTKDWGPHGTMVAGVTAARGNNNLGVAGVMWKANLRVYNYSYFTGKVTPLLKWERTATPSSIILMIYSAIKKGAKVINLSYGYCPELDPNCPKRNRATLENLQLSDNLFRTIVRHADLIGKDVLFIIAAGNNKNDIQTDSPARTWSEFDNVISVAAIDEDENLSDYSNWGDVTVAVPGDNIYSSLSDNNYGTMSGTSIAAPFVSGLAGLIWSKAEEMGKSLTAAEVKDLIIQGAISGGKYVAGPDGHQIPIINAYQSLKLLVSPPLEVAPWPMFMHDVRHTGQSEYSGPLTANLKWFYTLVPEMAIGYMGTPIIGQDGTIYIGAGTMDEGYLYAINPNGSLKWKSQPLEAAPSVPAISSNGTAYVYTGSYDFGRKIYALNPANGQEIWSFPVNNRVDYLTLSPDQTLYFTSETGYLYALDSNTGDLKWDYDFGTFAMVRSAPAIGPAGTIYLIKPGTTSILYAFNPNGSLKWSKAYGQGTAGSVSIAQEGTIYAVAGYDLYALDSQSEIIWTVSPGAEIETKTPALVDNQTIIIAGQERVWAYHTDNGSLKWTYQETAELYPSLPAIDKDGVIYLGFRTQNVTGPSKVLALNPDGSVKWQYSLKWLYSPPAISDGRLYLAGLDEDNNYNLYAFGE